MPGKEAGAARIRGRKRSYSLGYNAVISAKEVVAKGQVTALSFRTGTVRNPSGRDSHLSGHSPPCEVDPVQSMYRMTAESVVVS